MKVKTFSYNSGRYSGDALDDSDDVDRVLTNFLEKLTKENYKYKIETNAGLVHVFYDKLGFDEV